MKPGEFLSLLTSVQKTASGWSARCPAHDDHRASLSITTGSDGRILITCHAGCATDDIMATLGLRTADLFPVKVDLQAKPQLVKVYDYSNADGQLIFQVCRYTPKTFRQRRPDPAKPGEWLWNMQNVERVLYRLPAVLNAIDLGEPVYLTEGEKDADNLCALGFCATTNVGGASKWQRSYTQTLTGADVVVLPDKDRAGREHAALVQSELSGKAKTIKIVELDDRNGKRIKDVSDWLEAGGTREELEKLVEIAPPWAPVDSGSREIRSPNLKSGSAREEYFPTEAEDTILRLAGLSRFDYDRVRKPEAKRLGVRVETLDAEVDLHRQKTNTCAQGFDVGQPDIKPWSESVDGSALLNEIETVLRRYVVASNAAFTASALFVLHTYAFDLGDISPILFITAPAKRCGKSRLLSVLAKLVNRPLTACSASAAGIYRTIELSHPSLLIDEVDSFLKGDEQLRGLLNAGHTRDAAYHLGCVAKGDDFEPRRWSTWTPKILAGIGRLADTLTDRAIVVHMRRRLRDEPAERLHHKTRFEELQSKCAKFVSDHTEDIRVADPDVPAKLHDRAADNWTPLLVLADLVAGTWPAKAREAALELAGSEDIGTGEQLLVDIDRLFHQSDRDRFSSKDLCTGLADLEGRPWAEFGKARRPISPNQLAYLLREFGVVPHSVRIGDDTPKGYCLTDFETAFCRYLPSSGILKRHNATRPDNTGEDTLFAYATNAECCVSENPVLTNNDGPCGGVADRNPESGEETQTGPPEAMFI